MGDLLPVNPNPVNIEPMRGGGSGDNINTYSLLPAPLPGHEAPIEAMKGGADSLTSEKEEFDQNEEEEPPSWDQSLEGGFDPTFIQEGGGDNLRIETAIQPTVGGAIDTFFPIVLPAAAALPAGTGALTDAEWKSYTDNRLALGIPSINYNQSNTLNNIRGGGKKKFTVILNKEEYNGLYIYRITTLSKLYNILQPIQGPFAAGIAAANKKIILISFDSGDDTINIRAYVKIIRTILIDNQPNAIFLFNTRNIIDDETIKTKFNRIEQKNFYHRHLLNDFRPDGIRDKFRWYEPITIALKYFKDRPDDYLILFSEREFKDSNTDGKNTIFFDVDNEDYDDKTIEFDKRYEINTYKNSDKLSLYFTEPTSNKYFFISFLGGAVAAAAAAPAALPIAPIVPGAKNITIIGAGPVGLLAAIKIAETNAFNRIQIFEERFGPAQGLLPAAAGGVRPYYHNPVLPLALAPPALSAGELFYKDEIIFIPSTVYETYLPFRVRESLSSRLPELTGQAAAAIPNLPQINSPIVSKGYKNTKTLKLKTFLLANTPEGEYGYFVKVKDLQRALFTYLLTLIDSVGPGGAGVPRIQIHYRKRAARLDNGIITLHNLFEAAPAAGIPAAPPFVMPPIQHGILLVTVNRSLKLLTLENTYGASLQRIADISKLFRVQVEADVTADLDAPVAFESKFKIEYERALVQNRYRIFRTHENTHLCIKINISEDEFNKYYTALGNRERNQAVLGNASPLKVELGKIVSAFTGKIVEDIAINNFTISQKFIYKINTPARIITPVAPAAAPLITAPIFFLSDSVLTSDSLTDFSIPFGFESVSKITDIIREKLDVDQPAIDRYNAFIASKITEFIKIINETTIDFKGQQESCSPKKASLLRALLLDDARTDFTTPDLNLFSDQDICIFGNTIASEKTKEATAAAALPVATGVGADIKDFIFGGKTFKIRPQTADVIRDLAAGQFSAGELALFEAMGLVQTPMTGGGIKEELEEETKRGTEMNRLRQELVAGRGPFLLNLLDTSKQCNNDISLFWSKDCQESREYLRKLMLLRATEKINLLRKTVSSAAKASRLKFSDIARAIPGAAAAAAAAATAVSPAIGPARSLATAIASALGLLRPIPFSALPRLGFTSAAAGLLPVSRGLAGLSGLSPIGSAPLPGLGLGHDLGISHGPIGLTGLASLHPSRHSSLPSLFRRDDMVTRARRRVLGMRPVAAAAAVGALHPIPAPAAAP